MKNANPPRHQLPATHPRAGGAFRLHISYFPLPALSSFRHMSHKNSMQGLKIVFFIFYRVSAIALTVLFCSNLVFAETITELKDKAQAGNAEAQFKLGVRYYRGDGVDKNQVEAVKLLQKSSDKGNTYAQNLLATA